MERIATQISSGDSRVGPVADDLIRCDLNGDRAGCAFAVDPDSLITCVESSPIDSHRAIRTGCADAVHDDVADVLRDAVLVGNGAGPDGASAGLGLGAGLEAPGGTGQRSASRLGDGEAGAGDGYLDLRLGHLMAHTLVRILREELGHCGAGSAQIACAPRHLDLNDLEAWDAHVPDHTRAGRSGGSQGDFWYVNLPVTRTMAIGRERFDDTWLHRDFSWSPDRSEGVSFAKEDRATAFQFVAKLRASGYNEGGEVMAVLLPALTPEPHTP
jgi:hypothetical protein